MSTFRSLTGVLALTGMLAMPASALAESPRYNSLPNDYKTLQVSLEPGTQNYGTTKQVVPGEEVTLFVWKHNSAIQGSDGSLAIDSFAKVSGLPTGFATSHTLTGTVGASNATSASNSITLTSQVATKLSYIPGSAVFYKNINDTLTQVAWPAGVNGNDIVSPNGVRLGDQEACWKYAQAVLLKVKVEATNPVAVLTLSKEVRRAGVDQFVVKNTANPGNELEYRLTVKNVDGQGIATKLKLTDVLPADVTYVAGSTKVNGVAVADGITANGIEIDASFAPGETHVVTFKATTSKNIKSDVPCRVNKVTATADNAGNSGIMAQAETCFIFPTPTPTPTPTPSTTPTPTPAPTPNELPKTGGAELLLGVGALGGLSQAARMQRLKQQLKKRRSNLDVL